MNMIEKVATAIDPEAFKRLSLMAYTDVEQNWNARYHVRMRVGRAKARAQATAAIKAMREPTSHMLRLQRSRPEPPPLSHLEVFKDMIDAALEES